MFKNILSFKSGYRITIICAKILVFQSKLIMSSSSPTIEIMTAHIPIIKKSSSALPRKAVDTKKENEVAIPPNGDIFSLFSLFSFEIFFFLNPFVKSIKILFNKAERVIAKIRA